MKEETLIFKSKLQNQIKRVFFHKLAKATKIG